MTCLLKKNAGSGHSQLKQRSPVSHRCQYYRKQERKEVLGAVAVTYTGCHEGLMELAMDIEVEKPWPRLRSNIKGW